MALKSRCAAVALMLLGLAGTACSHPAPPPLGDATAPSVSVGSAKPARGERDHLLRPSFEDCSAKSGGVTSAMQSCMEVEYQYQDGRLQSAYLSLLHSQDAKSRQATKRRQVEWLAEKDRKCAWDAVHGGQAQRLEANYCNMQSTAQRAVELERRLLHSK